jgi:hypothetical protein
VTARDDDRISYLAGDEPGALSSAERAELDELRDVLGAPATWIEAPPRLGDDVVGAIAREAGTAPAPAAAPRRGLGTRLRQLGRLLAGHRLALAGSVLAAAAIAVVLGVTLGDGSAGPQPEQFAMIVLGTPLAPHARGSATLTKTASGWRIQLAAGGLPHLQNGAYYQAWLKNRAGILVPVGTFNDARRVTLWSGVPVTAFRTLTVTRQRADGNPASSGRRVLTGTIR